MVKDATWRCPWAGLGNASLNRVRLQLSCNWRPELEVDHIKLISQPLPATLETKVQRIKNAFTVQVYEGHARIALQQVSALRRLRIMSEKRPVRIASHNDQTANLLAVILFWESTSPIGQLRLCFIGGHMSVSQTLLWDRFLKYSQFCGCGSLVAVGWKHAA